MTQTYKVYIFVSLGEWYYSFALTICASSMCSVLANMCSMRLHDYSYIYLLLQSNKSYLKPIPAIYHLSQGPWAEIAIAYEM